MRFTRELAACEFVHKLPVGAPFYQLSARLSACGWTYSRSKKCTHTHVGTVSFLPMSSRSFVGNLNSSALAAEAALALNAGPLNSAQLVAQVCRMPGVPVAVADDIAIALLGDSPRFVRDQHGAWSLAPVADVAPYYQPAADSKLTDIPFLVVDVETTGHGQIYGDRIIEIAAFSLRHNEIDCVIDTLVNPQRAISPFVNRLTGISWMMVKDAPLFQEVSGDLMAALNSHIFVAHNVNFDWRFVSTEVSIAAGMPAVAPSSQRARLCTVKLARALLPGLPRRGLDHVAFHLGVDIENRHRAGGDALATAKILRLMLKRAAADGVFTWGDLQQLLNRRAGSKASRRRKKGKTRKFDT